MVVMHSLNVISYSEILSLSIFRPYIVCVSDEVSHTINDFCCKGSRTRGDRVGPYRRWMTTSVMFMTLNFAFMEYWQSTASCVA